MAMKHWIAYILMGAMGLGCAEMFTQEPTPPKPAVATPEAKPVAKPEAKPEVKPVPPPELVFPTDDLPEEQPQKKPAAPAKQEPAGGVSISIGELEAIELVPNRANAETAIEEPAVARKRPASKVVRDLLGDEEPAKPKPVAVAKPEPVTVVEKPEPKPVAVAVAKPEPKRKAPSSYSTWGVNPANLPPVRRLTASDKKPPVKIGYNKEPLYELESKPKPEPKPVAVVAKPEPKPEPKPVVVVAKPEPKPEPKPVVVVAKPKPVTPKPDFEGHYLSIELDQQPTVADATKTAYQQRWSVRRCSGTPSLFVTYDEKALGELESADVTIQPMTGGKVTYTELWLYAGKGKLTIGKHWLLSPFRHIVRGKMSPEQPFLPAGEYLITVQVNGSKTWDRQYIRVTVK